MKRKILLSLTFLFLLITLTSCGKKFTVTFDSQGGTPVDSIEVKSGKSVEKPNNPTKEGFSFIEWQLNGVAYDFASEITEDITLVAKWEVSSSGIKQLSQPKNLKVVENRVTWDAVEGAENYEVYVDGIKHVANTNTLELSNENLLIASIYVIAKSAQVTSDASDEIIYEKSLSDSELAECFGEEILSLLEEEPSMRPMYNRLALALIKYDFGYSELGEIENPMQLLTYIEEGRAEDLISLVLLYLDVYLENMHKIMYGEEAVIECEATPEQIQSFYSLLKSSNAYSSQYENADEDSRFMNLILPLICSETRYEYSVMRIVTRLTQDSSYLRHYYEVRRDGLNFIFKNEYLNAEYTITYDEIVNLMKFYDEIDYELLESLCGDIEYNYESYFLSTINKKVYEQKIEIASANFDELYKFISEKASSLGDIVEKLYDSYLTVMGYEEKVNELMESFNTIESQEEFTALLTDGRNFVLQVAQLLKDTLPNEQEVALLTELVEVCDISELVIIGYENEHIEVIANAFNTVIDVIKQMLATLDSISVEDIEALLPLMEGNLSDETLAKIEEIVTKFIDNISQSELLKKCDLEMLFDTFEAVLKVGNMDIRGVLNVMLGVEINDVEIQKIEAELESIITYLEAYDTTKLEAIFDSYLNGGIDFEEIIDETFNLVDYLVDYTNADLLSKYGSYFKGYMEMMYNGEDPELAAKLYNALVANYNNYKVYMKAAIKAGMAMVLEEMNGFEDEMLLQVQLMALHDSFTNENVSMFTSAYNAIGEATGLYPAKEFALFNENFEANIEHIMSLIGKHASQLTEEDEEMIEELEDHFPIDWYTPNLFEAVYNESNGTIDVVIKQQFRDVFADLAEMDCEDLEVSVISSNSGIGYGIAVEFVLSEDIYTLCQLSIVELQEVLQKNYYDYDEFKMNECEFNISHGYTHIYNETTHLWTENLYDIDLTEFVEMIYLYEVPAE